MPLLSIVSPVYRAEKIIPELVRRISEGATKLINDFEIVLVEDGSPDNSWKAIEDVCARDTRIKGIKLSRNFGQHYAITAGLSFSKGDYVIVMDCDLQDNPEYIETLYQKALEGYDIVLTRKEKREHSLFKNAMASLFFVIFNYLSDNKSVDANKYSGSYSLMSRKAVDAFLSIKEFHRHYLMVVQMLGFKKTYIDIKHDARFEGKTSYTFSKLVKHAVNGITSQSDKLLRISVSIGFIMFLLSVLWAAFIIIKYFTTGLLSGYASVMVSILLGTGMILISIGITGIYIGKIFEQAKGRPLFIVDKSINL